MTANNKLPLLKPKRVIITVSNDVTAGRPRPHRFLHCDWLQPRANSQKNGTCLLVRSHIAITSPARHRTSRVPDYTQRWMLSVKTVVGRTSTVASIVNSSIDQGRQFTTLSVRFGRTTCMLATRQSRSPAGPTMAWPLFLPRIFFTILCLLKSQPNLPPYNSTSAIHDRTTFLKPTTTLHVAAIDVQWRDFRSPEFGTKFQKEVSLFPS